MKQINTPSVAISLNSKPHYRGQFRKVFGIAARVETIGVGQTGLILV
jgi:hypothetical protein